MKEDLQIKKIDTSCKNYKSVYKSSCLKFNKLGNWLEKESSIFKKETTNNNKLYPNFKRGQVIKVDFGVNIGSELSNTHYAIVLNKDDNPKVDNITVLPLTSKEGYKRLYIGNILKETFKNENNSYALITQVTTISKKKIINENNKLFCNNDIMEKITKEIVKFIAK